MWRNAGRRLSEPHASTEGEHWAALRIVFSGFFPVRSVSVLWVPLRPRLTAGRDTHTLQTTKGGDKEILIAQRHPESIRSQLDWHSPQVRRKTLVFNGALMAELLIPLSKRREAVIKVGGMWRTAASWGPLWWRWRWSHSCWRQSDMEADCMFSKMRTHPSY